MLKVTFTEALVELLIYDVFHPLIDFDFCVFPVDQFNSFLHVDINAFVNQSFSERVLLPDVKSVSRIESQS